MMENELFAPSVSHYGKGFSAVLAVALILCTICACVGYRIAADDMRSQAVEQGHAEYYLDADHKRQWRWLPVEGE